VTTVAILSVAALLAALAYGFCCIFRLQAKANRENADDELIALPKRIEHRRRLEEARMQSSGRHALRERVPLR